MSGPAASPDESEIASPNPLPNEFLWHVHGNLSEQIKFADQKSGFVAVLATGVIGALRSEFFNDTPLSSWGFPQYIGALAFLLLVGALTACYASIAPRSRYTAPRGFIFWGAIATYESWDEFTRDLMGASPESLTEHLSHQTYALARICKAKYAWLNWAIALAVAGTEIGGAMFVYSSMAK